MEGAFQDMVDRVLMTVSGGSQRIYEQTYRAWGDWNDQAGQDKTVLDPRLVYTFLELTPVTLKTRQRMLAILRKMAMMEALDWENPVKHSRYQALRLLKVPTENTGGHERVYRVLSPLEVRAVMDLWQGKKLSFVRNRALFATLFFTGIRREELTTIRWADLDGVNRTLFIPHGKGDKGRYTAIVGDAQDTALAALIRWKERLRKAIGYLPTYAFPAMRKGGSVRADQPMHVTRINQLVQITCDQLDILFTPHDIRRTFATDLLARGYSIADVQAQLGHSNPATTIASYGMPADARVRQQRFTLSYGE